MFLRFVVALALFAPPLLAEPQTASAPPIAAPSTVVATPIPVESFASLPFVERAVISPDGSHIAGIFGIKGEQHIAIMPLFGDQLTATISPFPEGSEPGSVRWVNNDNIIITLTALRPVEGERWYISRIIGINRITRKVTRLLWDQNGQNAADVLWIARDGSNDILVAAQGTIYSNLPEFWPTIFRVDVSTGRKRKVMDGRPHVMDWGADHLGQIRIGLGYDDSTLTSRLLYRPTDRGFFKQIDRANYRMDESLAVPFLFLPGGDNALVLRDDDKGLSGIVEVNLATQEDVKTVFRPEKGEVAGVVTSHDGRLLGAYTTDKKNPIVWFDPALAKLQENFNKSVPTSEVAIESLSADQTKMLVRIDSAETPGSIYFYDINVGKLQKIAAVNDKLGGKKLSPVKVVQYTARDGLEIEGMLTMPKGRDSKNLPFIIMPHGGPWGHDTLDYDYWAQFLASRGYAVLQPNFRGSTGYGTEFMEKGKGQMGLAMQDDITDGVRWAVTQGIADPKRVCIVGASYGGYAAMWGIAKDPDLYRCAISISGVAALRREVNDFGDALRGNLYKKQWKDMTPDFNAVSPINAVARIKTPLMLVHGKRDITVDHVQSEKMNSVMTKAGKQVELVSLPLADHYFARQEDRVTLLSAMERFLTKHNPAN
jgi:dienelactone hydrolase